MDMEPNPPRWPPSVKILRPSDNRQELLRVLNEVASDGWDTEKQSHVSTKHHFSQRRIALLFAPGVYYGIEFEVGYYVQVLGLGSHPDDVQFRPASEAETSLEYGKTVPQNAVGPYVPALDKETKNPCGSSLAAFWRGAESFSCFGTPKSDDPTADTGHSTPFNTAARMVWAVSQAAPLRRIHVGTDLHLFDGGAYASGGFMADCQVDGRMDFGTQQQWLCRNCHFGSPVAGGAWSLVFVGCSGQLPNNDDRIHHNREVVGRVVSVKPQTVPVQLEKPYITMKNDGSQRFELRIPVATTNAASRTGTSFMTNNESRELIRDFSRVFVAHEHQDMVERRIQEALDDGKDVVLAAGIFHLEKSLIIKRSDQVILGIGFATIKCPSDGSPGLRITPGLEGVRIAGIMLEASPRCRKATDSNKQKSCLLEWGNEEENFNDGGNALNPGGLFDVFCRVGGDSQSTPHPSRRSEIFTNSMLRIHSGNVIGDNLWLWRADHAALIEGEEPNFAPIPSYHQTEEDEFCVDNGLEVTGNDVTVFGLAVEHTNQHQVIWNGERGSVYFYQCELPYDVRHATFGGENEFVGYLIQDQVQHHKLLAPGIYSNFRHEKVTVRTAIRHPPNDHNRASIQVVNAFTVHLDNHGCIESILNGEGKPAVTIGTPSRIA